MTTVIKKKNTMIAGVTNAKSTMIHTINAINTMIIVISAKDKNMSVIAKSITNAAIHLIAGLIYVIEIITAMYLTVGLIFAVEDTTKQKKEAHLQR